MPKLLASFVLGTVLFLGNVNAVVDSITIKYMQTKLEEEKIGVVDYSGVAKTEMITITVTNSTAKPWDDYDILFRNILPVKNAPNVVTISDVMVGKNPFTDFSIVENDFDFFEKVNGKEKIGKEALLLLIGGTVPAGGTFTVTLDLTLDNPVNVFGTPNVNPKPVPEPSGLLFLGTGMLGLIPVIRRKLRSRSICQKPYSAIASHHRCGLG